MDGRTDDRRRTLSGDNSSPDPFGSGELKSCHIEKLSGQEEEKTMGKKELEV
jgi:hypothetical protein